MHAYFEVFLNNMELIDIKDDSNNNKKDDIILPFKSLNDFFFLNLLRILYIIKMKKKMKYVYKNLSILKKTKYKLLSIYNKI